jgi:hypothetical protein
MSKDMKIIQDIIDMLKNAERRGSDKDIPEGSRYITISDTLAKEMIKVLRRYF